VTVAQTSTDLRGGSAPDGSGAAVVAQWNGRTARDLRVAHRWTVEEFAERLGLSARGVAKWEANPRQHQQVRVQAMLDVVLARADADTTARFHHLAAQPTHTTGPRHGRGDEQATGQATDTGTRQGAAAALPNPTVEQLVQLLGEAIAVLTQATAATTGPRAESHAQVAPLDQAADDDAGTVQSTDRSTAHGRSAHDDTDDTDDTDDADDDVWDADW